MIFGFLVDNEPICPECRDHEVPFRASLVPIRHSALAMSDGYDSTDKILCATCSDTIVEVIDDTQPPWEGAERRPIR